ncbi:hypothetical protein SESBI_38480 [Sesbania bispinosa]|nr:hypothetical protein SESBI_38480 [Sesbania bispinosa]
MGHYLVIQRWKPEFLPFEEEFKRVSVWIRIPGLPIEYYDDHILWRIGNVVGHTVKIDPNTLKQHDDELGPSVVTEHGKFARICVEVDLRKVLISRFRLNGRVYYVEYEGLLLICFNYGRFGHRKECCPLLANTAKSSYMPGNEQIASPESGHRVAGDKVDNGSSASEEMFGPWMMVQRKSRGKNQKGSEGDSPNAKSQGSNHAIPNHGRSGSRFNILNKESLDGTELT